MAFGVFGPESFGARKWDIKGSRLGALGRYRKALACFQRARAFNPQDAEARGNKGGDLAALGRREDAAQSYERFIAPPPIGYAVQVQYARQHVRRLRAS